MDRARCRSGRPRVQLYGSAALDGNLLVYAALPAADRGGARAAVHAPPAPPSRRGGADLARFDQVVVLPLLLETDLLLDFLVRGVYKQQR